MNNARRYKGYHDYDFCHGIRSQEAYLAELDAIEYRLCCIGCNLSFQPLTEITEKEVKELLAQYKECADEYDATFTENKYYRQYTDKYLDFLKDTTSK